MTAGQAPEVIRVTNDGNANVFNGVPDWVYEEEVRKSYKWDPECRSPASLNIGLRG